MNSFKDKVYGVVAGIPKGSVLTYKEVAELAGKPRACRAVGNILNRNRDPRVPCHRVIRSDGSAGGYAWGAAKKEALLREERLTIFKERHTAQGMHNGKGYPQTNALFRPPTSKVVPEAFFNRPVLMVAPDLLGKYLVRRIGGGRNGLKHIGKDRGAKTVALMITEVEAYDGPHDKACHASRGRTARTAPMFGPGGRFYVYFCYGVHWMLNIVTGPENYPAAILIRAAGGINGPARLTKKLRIDKTLNAKNARPQSGLWFEDRGARVQKKQIKTAPRIGVDYAGPVWSRKPFRFILRP